MIVKPSVVLSALMLLPQLASGQSVNGFPNWEERIFLEWTNRARSDPQYEMAQCGAPCTEGACYTPIVPLSYSLALNRSSRFHADYMQLGGAIQHDTNCTLRGDIDAVYPQTCNGARPCACSSLLGTTLWSTRISYFNAVPHSENFVYGSGFDVSGLFYFLLYEPGNSTSCVNTGVNGHRWNILKETGSLGSGWSPGSTDFAVMDFGNGSTPTKIVSGVHYPQQAAPVDFWANWNDSAAPLSASVYIDGARYPLTRARGSVTNGAWTTTASGVDTGCHRYSFAFTDSATVVQHYPSTGTFGIGVPPSCPDYAAPLTITTPQSVPPASVGVASATNQAGSTYAWSVTGGTINSGQGTQSITYLTGPSGTRMLLSVIRTGPAGAADAAGTAHVMVDFLDVPPSHPLHDFIIKLANNGVTAGCGGGNYCPDSLVLRSQMAIFLLRGEHGEGLTPPPATGTVFADVPQGSFGADFIEQLYGEGITGGCATNPLRYCPSSSVLRSQMAIFLLRAEHGSAYAPPPATGIFADVPPGSFGANFIERLYNEGVTGGCATNPLRYCPNDATTRGAMAVFLTRTFLLQ